MLILSVVDECNTFKKRAEKVAKLYEKWHTSIEKLKPCWRLQMSNYEV